MKGSFTRTPKKPGKNLTPLAASEMLCLRIQLVHHVHPHRTKKPDLAIEDESPIEITASPADGTVQVYMKTERQPGTYAV